MRKKDIRLLLQEVRSYLAGLTSLAEHAIGEDCPALHETLAKVDIAIEALR